MEEINQCIKMLVGKPERKNHFGDHSVDGSVKLKRR
jgi:hypothetical protein